MIPALVRKELRQLLPLVLALAALLLWGLVEDFVLSPVDVQEGGAGGWILDPGAGTGLMIFTALLGVITAYNLMPGEHEQRTIEFLYTLPVRRGVVFFTKFAVGSGLLVVFQLAAWGSDALAESLGLESFARRQQSGRLLLLELGLVSAFSVIALAYGMLISFFRRLGWLLLVVIGLVLRLAAELDPRLGLLGVQSLFQIEYHGTTPLVPWRAWLLHGLLAALALGAARVLWLHRQEDFAAIDERLRAGARLRKVAAVAAMIALAVSLPFLFTPTEEPATDQGAPGGAADRLRRIETPHFQLVYRQANETEARVVAAHAEAAYARVRERLGAPEIPTISADLTERSEEHLGIAAWKRLRMDIRPPRSEALLAHVLHHELTHVFAYAASEGWPAERRAEARLFMEGLAEYLAHELAPLDTPRREENRQIAALARTRYRISVPELFDVETLLARHDEHLLYALGEVWVAALVGGCGPDAPGRVLARLGRPGGPQNIRGLELWRNALQAEGCDLDGVAAEYEAILARERTAAAEFPVATARFAGQDGRDLLFEVRVASPRAATWPVAVRVRDDPSTPFVHQRQATGAQRSGGDGGGGAGGAGGVGGGGGGGGGGRGGAGPPLLLRVPRPPLTGARFEFQVGAARRPGGSWFYSRWQTTALTAR